MSRDDLKEIIVRVIEELEDDQAPLPACAFFGDGGCDVTTRYAVGEES